VFTGLLILIIGKEIHENSLRFMLPIITASLLVVGCGDKIMKPSLSYTKDNLLRKWILF
jgi:hypothetical protein